MDAGDYIYIVIAIVLAIINAIANKKKKDAAKRKAAEVEVEPETVLNDPADILQEFLTGKVESYPQDQPTPISQTLWPSENNGSIKHAEEKQIADTEKPKPYWSYELKEEPIQSVEYEQPFIEAKEDNLYPILDSKPIDVAENANFTSLDTFSSIEDSIGEFNYEELSVVVKEDETPDLIFEHEMAIAFEESAVKVVDDFDPKKAIIYAEIMTPKYI